MRIIDNNLKDKLLLAQQTLYNKANLSVRSVVSRPITSIETKQFWRECVITPGVTVVDSSLAIRHQFEDTLGDVVYAASVVGTTLTIKRAALTVGVTDMVWEVVETIENCTACALQFDGRFEYTDHAIIEFLTDAVPYLFFITTDGAIKYGIVGSALYETLVAANAVDVDVISGVSSKYGDIDQGLIVFYIVAGGVYYKQLIDGVWQDQESVSIAPANAVSVKAERLFDYRIVLHITDNTGALYEAFSKMEASGWNSQDFISAGISAVSSVIPIGYPNRYESEYVSAVILSASEALYILSPVMVAAKNIDNGEGNYGYKVLVTFDERVYNVDTGFSLTDSDSGAWPSLSAVKISDIVVEVTFANFNNANGDCSVMYTPGEMMGDIVAVEADSFVFTPTGLVPFATDPPAPTAISNIEDWSGSI